MSNTENKETMELRNDVIANMKDSGLIRTAGFKIEDGFFGEYKCSKPEYFKTKGSKIFNNFRFKVQNVHSGKSVAMSGYFFMNAFYIQKEKVTEFLNSVNDVRHDRLRVWFFSDNEESYKSLGKVSDQLSEAGSKIPDTMEVVGAFISKDQEEGVPFISYSHYPFYKTLLAWHHTHVDADAKGISLEQIEYALSVVGPNGPNVPVGFKFELRDKEKAVWEYRNWMPTFVIAF